MSRLTELHGQARIAGPSAEDATAAAQLLLATEPVALPPVESAGAGALVSSGQQQALLGSPRPRARRAASLGGDDGVAARGEPVLGLPIGVNAQLADASHLLGLHALPTLPTLQSFEAGVSMAPSAPAADAALPSPHLAAAGADYAAPSLMTKESGSSDGGFEDIDGDDALGDSTRADAGKDGALPLLPQQLTEQQKQRRWRAWAADARLIANPPSSTRGVQWDALVSLRTAAEAIPPLSVFAGGGNNAALANEVSQVRQDSGVPPPGQA